MGLWMAKISQRCAVSTFYTNHKNFLKKSLLYGPFDRDASLRGKGWMELRIQSFLTKAHEGGERKKTHRSAGQSLLQPPGNQSLTLAQDREAHDKVLP